MMPAPSSTQPLSGLAMKFLIENDVRQKASQKLQAEVAALLKREDI